MSEIPLRVPIVFENFEIWLMLSGGADSVFLFHRLLASQIKFSCLHFNHCLRPDESKEEEKFVQNLCCKFGVQLEIVRLNPPQNGTKIEQWGREQRYGYWSQLRKKNKAVAITAHHLDDFVESIYLNIERGCAWTGLCGPREIDLNRGLWRPLLFLEKAELLDFLKKKNLEWKEDSSNQNVKFARNRWRKNKQITKMSKENKLRWLKMGIFFQSKEEQLKNLENFFWTDLKIGEDQYELNPSSVKELGQNKELWYSFPVSLGCSGSWRSKAAQLILESEGQLSVDSQRNLVWSSPNLRLISHRAKEKKRFGVDFEIGTSVALQIGDKNYLLHSRVVLSEGRADCPAENAFCTLVSVSPGTRLFSLRTRRDGDCFSPRRLRSRTRKLKKFLHEVNCSRRDELPLVAIENEVVWIPEYGVNDFFEKFEHSVKVELKLYVQ